MNRRRLLPVMSLLVSLLVVLTGLTSTPVWAGQAAQEPPPPDGPSEFGPDMAPGEPPVKGAAVVSYHTETGQVRFISAALGQPIPRAQSLAADAPPEQAARGFLAAYGGLFGLQKPDQELRLMRVRAMDGGRSAVRFQQVYQGIPVVAGELIVQVDGQGNVLSASGEALPDLTLEPKPTISAEDARAKALEAVAKEYALSADDLGASEPELWIYDPALLGAPGLPGSALVWRVQVTPLDLLPFNEFVLIDAQRGSVTLRFNQLDTALDRLIYDNNNNPAVGLPGAGPVRVEGGPPTGVLDVNNAYDYSGFTYDFYATRHGRDSINDDGMQLVSTVRYCPEAALCPYANAFWNGSQMVYGAGYASADDVVAHELTHGVTEHESGLFCYMQSGAVNEALSDIWGELIDLSYTNGLDDDSPGVRWLMGENIPGGAIRSMSNPPAYGDPDRMGSGLYYCGTDDNGGVHTNGGVGNKAAFLMVDGGTFNGYTVGGLGIDKTAHIWYEAQTGLLTSGADYQDLHDALVQACDNLVGGYSITASDCDQVRKVVAATEMNQQPAGCAVPHAPLCDQYGFDSQLNGTAPEWSVVSGPWDVDANYLYTSGAASTFSWVATGASFADLDYSVRMRRQGCDICANTVIIRGTPQPLAPDGWWASGYLFQYARNGQVSVWRFEGGAAVALYNWAGSAAVATGDAWNTVRVVAEGGKLAFYINGDLVWSGVDHNLAFGQVGIGMYRTDDGAGDLLQVDWATLAGGTPLNLSWSDFEAGMGEWNTGALIGADEWYRESGYATSGQRMLYVWDQPDIADTYAAINAVALPAGQTAYLHFQHAYDFEMVFDGGVIEYSANGGPWTDAGSLITHNGYNGSLSTSFGNPLGGRGAFVYESYGYYSTRLNLGALAGQNVRVRFRVGTDSSIDDLGWIIDDVRFYTCAERASRAYLPMITTQGAPAAGFDSQFVGSSAGWTALTGPWTVAGGKYSTPGDANDTFASAYYSAASFGSLDYQARVRRVGSATIFSNGLMFRGAPTPLGPGNRWDSGYALLYAQDGSFSVWRNDGGMEYGLKGWTASNAINLGDAWNTLRVVAKGSSLSLYINGLLVWSGTDATYSSGRVGVIMADPAGSTDDRFDVDWARLVP